MSRKDYVALAAALDESDATIEVVLAVVRVLQADNASFDRSRFMSACGFGAPVVKLPRARTLAGIALDEIAQQTR
jgi:hypothetical protein